MSNLPARISPQDVIARVRGHAVILDANPAALYGVAVKRLNEQVRRNADRFPEPFMFRLTDVEWKSLRSQNATLKRGQHRKYLPLAFTEHGAIMAATVLNSPQAIQMSVAVGQLWRKIVVEKELHAARLCSNSRAVRTEIELISNQRATSLIEPLLAETPRAKTDVGMPS